MWQNMKYAQNTFVAYRNMVVSKESSRVTENHAMPFSFERMTGKQSLCRHGCLVASSEKWMQQSCHLKENNGQYLLPMITFEPSNKNYNFGKPVSATVNLTAFRYLKGFSDNICDDISKGDIFDIVLPWMCQRLEALPNLVNQYFLNA